MSLLVNKKKTSRGDSVYVGRIQNTTVENSNEPVGRASITFDSGVHQELGPQLTPVLARAPNFEPNLSPTIETPQTRKGTLGGPTKPDAKGDGGPGDNPKGQGNALETMQARFTAAKRSPVWDRYVRKVEEEDKDLVEDWDRIIDVILVFAALFSAISTGFVLESSKNLQPDQARATLLAIQSLTSALRPGANGSAVPETDPSSGPFKPTILTVWVNCLWFLSLGLSISVSLFAMLAKRWCYVFRSKRTGTSYERAMKRQKSWDAIEKWKIELLIEQVLPTLMHIALMLFFFGLVAYLAEIHQTTMIVTAAVVGLTILLYIILTVLPIWYQNCPMVTPFTRIVLDFTQSFKFIVAQAWLQVENTSILLRAWSVYEPLSNWQELLGVLASIPGRACHLIKTGLVALWTQFISFDAAKVPFMKWKEKPSNEADWVIYGCMDCTVGKTIPRPQPDESNRDMFNALAWILKNSTDRETVKEVLDHINSFPDVILDSSADSDQLYMVASTAAEHLNRFQHDPAEWRDALPISPPCARLIYLTIRSWLHKSTGLDSKYFEIWDLASKFNLFGSIYMSSEEVDKWITTIKDNVTKQSEPTSWLEGLAGKIVLGCAAESHLKVCTTLGRKVSGKEFEAVLRARCMEVEVYSTLCWVFLNSVMSCTYGSWPSNNAEEPKDLILVSSDSMLTLSHFRDSRKRQESRLWLSIVGITGMLYAFTNYPDHKDGPSVDSNSQYFVRLIGFLRATLHNSIPDNMDSFLGDIPVYNNAEVRTYQFDSLQYGIDALNSALISSIYANCSFKGDLSALLHDLKVIKDFKDSLLSKPEPNYGRILKAYWSEEWVNHLPGMLLAAGVFVNEFGWYRLGRDRAHLFASFLSDMIFGRNGLDQPTASSLSKAHVGMIPTTEQHITASSNIAASSWAWIPFPAPTSSVEWETKYPNYMRHDLIWEQLENLGLLHASIEPFEVYRFFSDNFRITENQEEGRREAHRAAGYCLYIKASLLDRLYSFSTTGARSPDILAWSIALAKHVVELLQFWDVAVFDLDEQTHIISSLMKLTNTLLDALKDTTSSEPTTSSPDHTTPIHIVSANTTDARSQLEALIKAGVLPVLACPFSSHSLPPATVSSDHTPNESDWHNTLVRTIERLARTFPGLRAEKNSATAIDDALRAMGKPEWTFSQTNETSSNHEGENHETLHDNNEFDFYSGLVEYYEAKVLESDAESQPMLELVKRLRDDMKTRHQPVCPQVESPNDIRIDMPRVS